MLTEDEISECKSIIKESLSKNISIYAMVIPSRNPKRQVYRIAELVDRGVTLDIHGHKWFMEWCEIENLWQ